MRILDILNENPQEQGPSSERALQTLINYAEQFKGHPGKLGSLAMLTIQELDRAGNAAARDQLRATVEPIYGRYQPSTPRVSNKKRAVRQRGQEAGDKPTFNTRQQARDFASDQNQHGKQRQVQDAGRKSKGPRWSAAKTSLRNT